MRNSRWAALAAAVAAFLPLALAAAAPAEAAPPAAAPERVVAAADDSCYFLWTEYTYTGKFRCDTFVKHGEWIASFGEESFGIAPDRTIWHAWPNSGGWLEMPNSGKADSIWAAYINGNGQRQVEVCVYSGTGNRVWYSYYSGGWRGWFEDPASFSCT